MCFCTRRHSLLRGGPEDKASLVKTLCHDRSCLPDVHSNYLHTRAGNKVAQAKWEAQQAHNENEQSCVPRFGLWGLKEEQYKSPNSSTNTCRKGERKREIGMQLVRVQVEIFSLLRHKSNKAEIFF